VNILLTKPKEEENKGIAGKGEFFGMGEEL